MKSLQELVKVATTSYNDSLDEMQSSVQSNINSVESIAKDGQNNIHSLNEVWNEFKSQFSTIFTKDRLTLEQGLSLKNNCQETQNVDEQSMSKLLSSVESAQKAIFEGIEKLTQTVGQQRQDVEELVMKQNSQVKRMANITARSFESVKKDLGLVFDRQSNVY